MGTCQALTMRSGAVLSRASAIAHASAFEAPSEPSTPTTIPFGIASLLRVGSKIYENFIRNQGRAHRDAPRLACGLSRIRSSFGSQAAAAATSATRDNPTSAAAAYAS